MTMYATVAETGKEPADSCRQTVLAGPVEPKEPSAETESRRFPRPSAGLIALIVGGAALALPGVVAIAMLAKVLATVGPWQLTQLITPWCVPVTEYAA